MEKTIMPGTIEDNRKRASPNMRWMDSIKEAIGMRLQELSLAVEDRTLWTSLIHGVIRSRSQLNSTHHKKNLKVNLCD